MTPTERAAYYKGMITGIECLIESFSKYRNLRRGIDPDSILVELYAVRDKLKEDAAD